MERVESISLVEIRFLPRLPPASASEFPMLWLVSPVFPPPGTEQLFQKRPLWVSVRSLDLIYSVSHNSQSRNRLIVFTR